MNFHKKLLQIGFTKGHPHKIEYGPYGINSIVPDTYEKKMVSKNGQKMIMKCKKEHPKWDVFYFLQYSSDLKIWVHLQKQTYIKEILIEGESVIGGAREIYHGNFQINSKMDIINLFPKDIQREFIINLLFK